jgi:hypothetical protein
MKGERHPARLAVTEAREQVLEQLSEAFAKDELGLDEFEARIDGAYQASTEVGLRALVNDLAPPVAPASTELLRTAAPSTALASAPQVPRRARVLAVLGNVERRGRFQVPDGYRATSVLGNIELDLRDVVLGDGVTHLYVRAVLGNIEIVVPPDLPVECEGTGFLASFAQLNRIPAEGTAAGPLLRIIGSAVLGNVEIRTLPRGLSVSVPRPRALPPKGDREP